MTKSDGSEKLGPEGRRALAGLELNDKERGFYSALAVEGADRATDQQFTIAGKTGRGFTVNAGQILRIQCDKASQVGDFVLFNRQDPREHFSQSRTRGVHGAHVTAGDRLWSHPIYRRPMMTMIADTVDRSPRPSGAVPHDLLFNMCDENLHFRLTGEMGLPNCRDNLTRTLDDFHIGAHQVPDPLNLFMVTGLNPAGKMFYDPPVAGAGDYVELFAEMDLICALSACPGACSGPEPGGLAVEIWNTKAGEK
ncbi:MAG: urea carboxylase-associated family protein [Rhodospirillales bacterium]|nr:urea carboxylase-associated family protein [Rhodospirillales bacterium]